MVDPSLGGRIDYREVVENIDLESLFEGTRFDNEEDGVVASIGAELGEIIGRLLGAAAGFLFGAVLLAAKGDGDGETGEEDVAGEEGDAASDSEGDTPTDGAENQEAEA